MRPTCRQVPPRYGTFSTTIVFNPSSPARIAATYPPGPLPIIATSYLATRNLPSAETLPSQTSVLTPASSTGLSAVAPSLEDLRLPYDRPASKLLQFLWDTHPANRR